MKAGTQIVVMCDPIFTDIQPKVVRALVLRGGGQQWVRFRIWPPDVAALRPKAHGRPNKFAAAKLQADHEGTRWALGWDTEAARALYAAAALM